MKFLGFILISFFTLIIDISSKHLALQMLQDGNVIIFKDFALILSYNTGIAFSLPLKGFIQIIGSIILLIGLLWYGHREWKWEQWLPSIALAAITGGALGNLYERVFIGKVTDFIQIASWYPIFNAADIFIFIGVVLLIIFQWKAFKA